MARFTRLSTLALCAFAAPAMADVTPDEVWSNLQGYLEGFGYTVSVGARDGLGDPDLLILRDVSVAMSTSGDDLATRTTLDEIAFRATGDGRVAVSMPSNVPLVVSAVEGGTRTDTTLSLSLDDMVLTASGTPDDVNYDYTARSYGLTLDQLVVDGRVLESDLARIEGRASPVSGQARIAVDDGVVQADQQMSLGTVSLSGALDVAEVENGEVEVGDIETVLFNARYQDLAQDVAVSLPAGAAGLGLMEALSAGMTSTGTLSHSGGEFEVSAQGADHGFVARIASSEGLVDTVMSSERITYAVQSRAGRIGLTAPQARFPLDATLEGYSARMSLPLQPGDAPQPGELLIDLDGLALSQQIWDRFDPARALPRDPASLRLDLTTQVSPVANLLDPRTMAWVSKEEIVPVLLETLTLNGLRIEALGTLLQGTADLTFDNSTNEALDSIPMPEGRISLNLQGANALLGALVQAGFLPQEQVIGLRLMLAQMALPGNGPDTLVSDIELGPNGRISVNGTRIQ